MTAAEIILAAVTLQRAAELFLSRHNTRKLMARGAIEVAPGHYPLIVAVHAAWINRRSLWPMPLSSQLRSIISKRRPEASIPISF